MPTLLQAVRRPSDYSISIVDLHGCMMLLVTRLFSHVRPSLWSLSHRVQVISFAYPFRLRPSESLFARVGRQISYSALVLYRAQTE